MELVKCPDSGYKAYVFKVTCDCVCHTKGYQQIFIANPCCTCDNAGKGKAAGLKKLWLYPLDQFHSYFTLKKVEAINYRNINQYPELLDLMKIEKVFI